MNPVPLAVRLYVSLGGEDREQNKETERVLLFLWVGTGNFRLV